VYYIVYVMQGAGIGNPLLTSSIQYIINVALTLPAILYMDKWGRRPSLLLGSFGMMTWLFVSGAIQGRYGEPQSRHPTSENQQVTWILYKKNPQARAVVACSYLFVATFATTWGPVSWTCMQNSPTQPSHFFFFTNASTYVDPSEIFPSKVRAKAVSLATASNWAWNCALAFAVPPLLRNINWKMYMIFGSFNGAALIHMFLTAPETKGRTLEEMDEVFDSGIPAWRKVPVSSRLDRLQKDIEAGNLKIIAPTSAAADTAHSEPSDQKTQ
jgi:MFS family permease